MKGSALITGLVIMMLISGIWSGCSKKKLEEKAYEPSTLNKVFEDYILNKDITITEAKFNGKDTTAMFNGYVFKLLKDTYYKGPFQARTGSAMYTGTWESNEDYSNLILNIKDNDTLKWISLQWKFKSKSFTFLELVPWFNTDGDKYLKFQK